MHLLARCSIGASDGQGEDHVRAGAVLIGGGGAHCALPHGACQQVGHPPWPPHVNPLQEANRCHALVIMRHLQSVDRHCEQSCRVSCLKPVLSPLMQKYT